MGLIEVEQLCFGCGESSRYGLNHRHCTRTEVAGVSCWWEATGVLSRLLKDVEELGYYDCLQEIVALGVSELKRDEFRMLRRFLCYEPVIVGLPCGRTMERELGYNPHHKLARYLARQMDLSTKTVVESSDQYVLLVGCRLELVKLKAYLEANNHINQRLLWVLCIAR